MFCAVTYQKLLHGNIDPYPRDPQTVCVFLHKFTCLDDHIIPQGFHNTIALGQDVYKRQRTLNRFTPNVSASSPSEGSLSPGSHV